MIAPHLLSAKMHCVEVRWRIRTTRAFVIGPEPRLILAVRARQDIEMTSLLVSFPEMLHRDVGVAESLLAEVPHVYGLRRLKPEGEPWAWGQENVDARPMLGGKPEDAAKASSQIRWHGGTVALVERMLTAHPYDFWCWRGRIAVPKGVSLGVIVRCEQSTICRVRMSGE